MGKSLSKAVKRGVSRGPSAMSFQVSREDALSATIRTDNGTADRMYEFESSVVAKPSPGRKKWLVLPL